MNLTAEQVRNLNILADFMDGLDDPGFTMSLLEHQCGAPACALGYACSMMEFNIKKGISSSSNGVQPDLHREVTRVFGVVYAKLFSGDLAMKIRTPQQWAAHCRAFLKANGYTTDHFKTFMDRVMVPVDTKETIVAVK